MTLLSLLGRLGAPRRSYRTRIGAGEEAGQGSRDQRQAAESLEYEKRGYKVDFVSRNGLPATASAPNELARNTYSIGGSASHHITLLLSSTTWSLSNVCGRRLRVIPKNTGL
jgi:hypothetical protein